MKKISYLTLVLFFFSFQPGFSQQDSAQHKKDSVQNLQLDSQLARIRQLSAERVADSLKKTDLQKQVAALNSADNLKRLDLLKELSAIKEKDSLRLQHQKHQVDSLRKFVKGFAVVPFRDTLFRLYTRQGSFTAQERAEAICERIEKLAGNSLFNPDSLKLANGEMTTDIVFKDQLILSVSEPDALWQNTDRRALAAVWKKLIGSAVAVHRKETR